MKANKRSVEEIERYIISVGSDSLPVFGGTYEGGVHIQQIPDELAPCILAIVESGEKVRSFLEIGVAAGGTTFTLNHFLDPDRIVLIDNNAHPKHILRPYILKDIVCEEIIGNSRDPEIIARPKGPFDLVIIDGDHSYEAVKEDVKNYLPKLRKGGFLVLHDSATNQWGCEVSQVVEELKESTNVQLVNEYISVKHSSPCGLALFRKVSE